MNKKDLMKMVTLENSVILILLLVLVGLVYEYVNRDGFTNPTRRRVDNFRNSYRQPNGRLERFYGTNPPNPKVHFYFVTWCGYCDKGKPEIQTLDEDPNIDVIYHCCQTEEEGKCATAIEGKTLAAEKETTCKEQNITGYPTIKIDMGDGVQQEYVGACTAENIRRKIKQLKGSN